MMLLLRVAWKLEANRPDATAKKIGQDQKESKGQACPACFLLGEDRGEETKLAIFRVMNLDRKSRDETERSARQKKPRDPQP